jgi:hypothetical protein
MSRVNKPTVVITHHALSLPTHTVKDVDTWHRERWPGFVSRTGYHVGYHYVIETDGSITQTREHDEEGAHTLGMNTSSIGVCFMGNFDLHYPSNAQLVTWDKLYTKLKAEYPNIPTKPHRAYASYKSCHGKLLIDEYFSLEHQRLTKLEDLKRQLAKLQSLLRKKQR